MAACVLDGDKVCEVAGNVKWSSMDRFMADYSSGSLALYKLSSSYYIHGITGVKRVKYLLRPDKFQVFYRESRLTLSITPDKLNKGAVSIHLKDAAPNQLRTFLDSLNVLKTYFAAFRGKLSSSSTRVENIQNIENQPHNNSNLTSPRVTKYESPLRSNLVTSTPNQSAHRASPNYPSNYHAKQMNPPSSYSSQNKKTPLGDQTFARENLSNTSSSKKSASSFYGSRISGWSPSNRKFTSTPSGPGLLPPPRPKIQSTLASQISFRSREKNPLVKDVALTGFSNLGNTCYMNAILQSLLGLPPFVQDLLNKTLLDEVHPECLYSCLYNVLYCKKKGGNPEVLKNWLKKLKRTISEAATRFSGYHQHDAHEFLCQVFDQLKDDVSLCCSPSSKDTSNESNKLLTDTKCPVTRSFESGVVHTVSCKQCGESTPKEEIYHAFSLDIPVLCNSSNVSSLGAVSMQALIEKHFKNEELEYTCSKCESKEAVISHSFSRLPRVLILHLKRYGYDNLTEEQAKKQDKVNIERFIDLRHLCSSKSKPPLLFQPKTSLKLSPAKSNRKPQKRHYIRDDDDDDVSNDFQPSPSVRRKLAHSFLDTMTSSTTEDSSQNTKVNNSKDGVEITGILKSKKTSELSKLDKTEHRGVDKATTGEDCIQLDVDQNANLEHTPRNEIPVWDRPEEDQIKWVLAESAKAAERESRVKMKEQEWNRTVTKSRRETETDSWDFNNEDFNLLSDMSYEDLVSATQESGPEEVHGLKGGGPITYTTQQQSQDFDFDSILEMEQNKNCTVDSGSEKSPSVLKNRPLRKRPNCYQARKPKTPGEVSVARTPTLGRFDGDLFEDSVKENKVNTNDISVSDSPKRSWFSGSFRDEDMAKAINLSLQDQKMMTDEDEELNRALQLSLREFEGSTADEPVSPAGVGTENLTDSTFQDEGGELSTHSYRLISIVSHLGSSSTSGHYISDVYDCKTKQWTSYDDSTATKVTEHGVRYKRQHSGYIFFYLYKQCVDAIENASPSKENTQR